MNLDINQDQAAILNKNFGGSRKLRQNKCYSIPFRYCLVVYVILLLSVSGCVDGLRQRNPCQLLNTIDNEDIIGTWRATYDHYASPDTPSEMITGSETIIFSANHTYSQTLNTTEFEYVEADLHWEFVAENHDGYKLKMDGLKYFANGVLYSEQEFLLSPQIRDKLNRTKHLDNAENNEKITIHYPTDGFLFLYPRACTGQLVLLQMISGVGDPDSLNILHPIFYKIE